MTISVLIVDDVVTFRAGLRLLLEALADVRVVGEAGDGVEALVLAEQLLPEVVVMDVSMPHMDGLEATSRLRRQRPHIRVVMLSAEGDAQMVRKAVQQGAHGYILKDDLVAHLPQAITAAASGQYYFSPSLVVPGLPSNRWPTNGE